jgi:hypothetical protein
MLVNLAIRDFLQRQGVSGCIGPERSRLASATTHSAEVSSSYKAAADL